MVYREERGRKDEGDSVQAGRKGTRGKHVQESKIKLRRRLLFPVSFISSIALDPW